jgi:2-C-methyl-D-erythritol 4-phosphate cytidylyltransferase
VKKKDIFAILVAAGEGLRWKASSPPFFKKKGKIFSPLGKTPLLIWALRVFDDSEDIKRVYLVLNKKDLEKGENLLLSYNIRKVERIIEGGKSRQESVYNALRAWEATEYFVLIHDGARPLINSSMIKELKEALLAHHEYSGAIFTLPVKDTLKLIEGREVKETLNRNKFCLVQTPQLFFKDIIVKAYDKWKDKLEDFSDDAGIVEKFGAKVLSLPGREENIKITTYSDLIIARGFLKWKRR